MVGVERALFGGGSGRRVGVMAQTQARARAVSSAAIAEPAVIHSTRATPSRIDLRICDGQILLGSDLHASPNEPASTAWRGFVHLTKLLQPQAVVLNGDVCDFPTISKHPRADWSDRRPTVKEEIACAQARLREIQRAAPLPAQLYWVRGNHCRRLEGTLAARAPELEGLLGTRLADHFDERWQHSVSLRVNENVRIKHQLSGGSTAAATNARKAGCSIICGHTHSLKVFPVSNYTGTFFGVDSGMLANPQSSLFGYCEDAPCDWRSGFVLLTFCAGVLQWPEVVPVVTESPEPGEGTVWFRGELIAV
jgi:UDP-2,3-diacylglucosamine pyrophosphatase LpxH